MRLEFFHHCQSRRQIVCRFKFSQGCQRLEQGCQQEIKYQPNGNIDWTTEAGQYTYDPSHPHAVQTVADVDSAPVRIDGPLIETHSRFPQRVNAGFMQIVDRNRIRLRVYERGAGETLACGTGACAAVVAGRVHGLRVAARSSTRSASSSRLITNALPVWRWQFRQWQQLTNSGSEVSR